MKGLATFAWFVATLYAQDPEPSGATAFGPSERCGNKLGKVKIGAGETAVLQLQVCK